jgi:predicted GNAT superfamily acetyltransferase
MDVRELTTTAELHAASALLARIWRPTDPMPYEMLRVIRHIGGYVSGAFEADTLIGACAAFPTAAGGLHSHITGATAPGRGVGLAVKLHQRTWALDRGITRISWTFDPLVRRNAYFNLAKLAARAEEYLEDFYGEMPDELNAGDPSDRLLVVWDLRDPAVAAVADGAAGARDAVRDGAAEGEATSGDETTGDGPPGRGVTVALTDDPSGRPVERDPAGADRLAIGTPADIAALRARDPLLAREWRRRQRAALGGALAAGYHVTGFTRSGHYLLEVAR